MYIVKIYYIMYTYILVLRIYYKLYLYANGWFASAKENPTNLNEQCRWQWFPKTDAQLGT